MVREGFQQQKMLYSELKTWHKKNNNFTDSNQNMTKFKTQNLTKHKNSKCERKKIYYSKFDKTQELKMWQN